MVGWWADQTLPPITAISRQRKAPPNRAGPYTTRTRGSVSSAVKAIRGAATGSRKKKPRRSGARRTRYIAEGGSLGFRSEDNYERRDWFHKKKSPAGWDDDGRHQHRVERSMRPQALTRKNALFAGHDLARQLVGQRLEPGRLSRRSK